MKIELDEVEIELLEQGLRSLEAEEGADPDHFMDSDGTIIRGRTRRFTMLRAKLAGIPVPADYRSPY